MDMIINKIEKILEKHNYERRGLISIFEEIQASFGYLSQEILTIVADRLDCSLGDIYGVASFYKSFTLKPRGKHLISTCQGTACHVRGAPTVLEEFKRKLEIKEDQTTKDREFTLETANCLGACALGPIVVVDGHYFSNVHTSRVWSILKKTRAGLDSIQIKDDKRIFPVEVSCFRCNHSLMNRQHLIDDYPSIRVTISFGQKHGWLALSSLYGSYHVSSEYEIPEDIIIHFFCPHCHAELLGAFNCGECGAYMVPMIIRGGGVVQICSRSNCKGHILDLNETTIA